MTATSLEPHTGESWQQELLRRDSETFFNQANTSPCPIAYTKAEGTWVEDAAGKRYMDWNGNNCHNLGYGHPRVVNAIHEQLANLPFVPRGYTAETSILLAEKLAELWPGETARVSLVPGGASAVEIALDLARVYTGRTKIISFYTSYHGRSAGALSVSSPAKGRSPKLEPLVPGTIFVPPFYDFARPDAAEEMAQRSLQAIRDALEFEGGIAALIAEPIRNGPFLPPEGYWAEVQRLCQKHGTILIFDEVPVGLGRTGKMFASDHFGVIPDMTTIGKSLGGTALPIAAVIADDRLNCSPDLNIHYYTHDKNPLTAAAGLATLNVLEDEGLCQRAAQLGTEYLPELQRIGAASSVVQDVRGVGLMFGIGFAGVNGGEVATAFVNAVREEGLIANGRGGNQVTIAPPLNIDSKDLALGLEMVDRAIARIAN